MQRETESGVWVSIFLHRLPRWDRWNIILRKYNKTRQKDEWALRCKNPLLVNEYNLDIFPLLNVDKDSFKALFEVDYRAGIFCITLNCILKGDKNLLGHWTKRQANISHNSERAWVDEVILRWSVGELLLRQAIDIS